MILPDANVLVGAHRADAEHHADLARWLADEVNSGRPFVLADAAVAGFLRIVTHPRIFDPPTPRDDALAFIDGLYAQPGCLPMGAGPRHWPILREVITRADARGNLVPDAHLAAVAIERGATVATRDRGFARFSDVVWFDPIA